MSRADDCGICISISYVQLWLPVSQPVIQSVSRFLPPPYDSLFIIGLITLLFQLTSAQRVWDPATYSERGCLSALLHSYIHTGLALVGFDRN